MKLPTLRIPRLSFLLVCLLPACSTTIEVLDSRDGAAPDGAAPDGAAPDGAAPDASLDSGSPLDASPDATSPDAASPDAAPPLHDLSTCEGRARATCDWAWSCLPRVPQLFWADGYLQCVSETRGRCRLRETFEPAILPADPIACLQTQLDTCPGVYEPLELIANLEPSAACVSPAVGTREEGETCFESWQCGRSGGTQMVCSGSSARDCPGVCVATAPLGAPCDAVNVSALCDPSTGAVCVPSYDADAPDRSGDDPLCRVPSRGGLGADCSDSSDRWCEEGLVCNVLGVCQPPLGVGDPCGRTPIALRATCGEQSAFIECVEVPGEPHGRCVDVTGQRAGPGDRCDTDPPATCIGEPACPADGVCPTSGVALDAACSEEEPLCVWAQTCVAGRCEDAARECPGD